MQFENQIHELIKTERLGSPAFYADCDASDARNVKTSLRPTFLFACLTPNRTTPTFGVTYAFGDVRRSDWQNFLHPDSIYDHTDQEQSHGA
jgi:hypothetical protein